MAEQLALTVTEAARALAVSPSMLRRLIAEGRIAKVPHLGRAVRISSAELRRFADDQRHAEVA